MSQSFKETRHRPNNGAEKVPGSPGGPSIRVLLVDDHPAIIRALTDTIDSTPGIDVIGASETLGEAVTLLDQLRPDVVIVDIRLKDGYGLDLIQHARITHPDTRIVVFSMYADEIFAERAVRAGAKAYVMKTEPTRKIIEAIRLVMVGDVYVSQRVAFKILSALSSGSATRARSNIEKFTDREMAVFQLIGDGVSIDNIATQLRLSRKTVETYRRRAREKLGLETVDDLLRYAVNWARGRGELA